MTRQFDVTAMGEMLLRLSVPAGERLEVASALSLSPAGAEGNVLTALARLGHRCGLVTSLPANGLGTLVANHLRMARVDLQGTLWTEAGRVGTYYVEFAQAPRATRVLYDRAGSSFAQMDPEKVNWELLLDTRLIHLTGITPALSPDSQALMTEALHRAHQAGVPISLDVNYRRNLWSPAEARSFLEGALRGVELLFCRQSDAKELFDLDGSPDEVARALARKSGANLVVVTLGEDGALAWDGEQLYEERALAVQVLDRLGAGDAFAAGVIHGWLCSDLALGLRFGVVLAALALTQHGDLLLTSLEEVDGILAGNTTRIAR